MTSRGAPLHGSLRSRRGYGGGVRLPSTVAAAPGGHLADGLLLLWCVFWLVVGGLVGRAVWQLTAVGDTVSRSGMAIDDAGEALQSLGDLPFVGESTGRLGDEVRARAADVVASAAEAQDDVRRLAILTGGAVALLPTAPVLALVVPARLRARRDAQDVQRALATDGREAVEAYLATRALATLPLATLRHYTPTPLRDAHEGRHAALASAELARLGLRRTGGDTAGSAGRG